MTPCIFSESNVTLKKPSTMTDDECTSLPIFTDGAQCVSCWKPSWKERLSILFFGKVWLSVIGGHTQPPVWLIGRNNIFVRKEVSCHE